MGQIADAINRAPTGNVISGSEMEVRDLMAQLRQKAFELGVQMRVDFSESTFPPPQDAVRIAKVTRGGRTAVERVMVPSKRTVKFKVGRLMKAKMAEIAKNHPVTANDGAAAKV